jgi:membrane glycosyltransferase
MVEQAIEMASFSDVAHSLGEWRRGGLLALLHSRRVIVLAAVLGSTGAATVGMWERFGPDPLTMADRVTGLLFVINFGWISALFWNALAGFVKMWFGWRTEGIIWPESGIDTNGGSQTGLTGRPLTGPRNVILMPVHNEDPARVYAGLQAIYESLIQAGGHSMFDFFILSDTTKPRIWLAEEMGWKRLCRALGGNPRLFYRRRRKNTGKKAGNIAEFCRKWGHCYDSMVILDADSVMTGSTLVTLSRLMERNPKIGIIQVPSFTVNHATLFARIQQFAARLYGPLVFGGLSFWQKEDGNYWGHNAIIRISAFMGNCGLPKLPGKPPLGGYIRSHDFVEAAFMRRAGWSVVLLPELAGSYEEAPPTLLEYVRRDWRWCQGNLQHVRILPVKGLHGMSRVHLGVGIMSYVSSLLWLAFLVTGLISAVEHVRFQAITATGFQVGFTSVGGGRFQSGLLAAMLVMLLGPRVLSFTLLLQSSELARKFGGYSRALLGVVLETAFSTLLAPTMMLFQTGFIISTLLEGDSGWNCQQRDDKGVSIGEAVRGLWLHFLIGVVFALAAWQVSGVLLLLFLPIVAGLLLSIPLSCVSSRNSIGVWARKHKMFLIPEEMQPPLILSRLNVLSRRWNRILYGE